MYLPQAVKPQSLVLPQNNYLINRFVFWTHYGYKVLERIICRELRHSRRTSSESTIDAIKGVVDDTVATAIEEKRLRFGTIEYCALVTLNI